MKNQGEHTKECKPWFCVVDKRRKKVEERNKLVANKKGAKEFRP